MVSKRYGLLALGGVVVYKIDESVVCDWSVRSNGLLAHTMLWKPRAPVFEPSEGGFQIKEDD